MKREIFVGNVGIGGDHPVSLQSMTNTPTENVTATLEQIFQLQRAGCDLVRVAVPNEAVLASLQQIVQRSPIPVIADIHFDASLALRSIEYGAHGIRINPGNIGSKSKIFPEGARQRSLLTAALMNFSSKEALWAINKAAPANSVKPSRASGRDACPATI